MNKDQLLTLLRQLQHEDPDVESEHITADRLLVDYINDPDIKTEYDKIKKWYA